MKITMKRAFSLMLALSIALGLLLPMADRAQAAENDSAGTLVSDNVISEYKSGVFHGLTKNAEGQDLLAVPIYGSKMIVYNLDTWEVADEVYTAVPNPRGATVDSEGRVWVCGDSRTLCCYDPKTRACFISSNMALGAGSAFAITQGTDGNLYFGTSPNAKVAHYNIATDTFTDLGTPVVTVGGVQQSFSYASAVVQKDSYIYTSLHGETAHYIVKLDMDGTVVKALDISGKMDTTRYLSGLDFVEGTDILVGYCTSSAMGSIIVDAQTMTEMTLGDFDKPIKGNVTESLNGKVYFATYESITVGDTNYTNLLYSYDIEAGVAEPVVKADGGYLYGNILRGNAKNIVTDGIAYLDISGPCLVTVQNTILIIYDIQNAVRYQFSGESSPANESQGTGQSLRAVTLGLSGSNEIYFGAYDTNAVVSYNTATGEITKVASAAGSQTDSYCWYEDTLYCGNYNVASLTRIVDGNAASLFQLNNESFEQARIHTLTAGDNKIFAGTTPDMYYHGGTIAWYDLSSGYTYVVTGTEKSDVYYAKTFDEAAYIAGKVDSGLVADPVWYNASTGEAASFSRSDFTGVIPDQAINKLIYDEESGLLYGTTSTHGGTSTDPLTDVNAVLFVYDVNAMKLVTTYDLTTELGLTTQVSFIAGIEKDPDYANNGKFWGVVSETLFTFTYDESAKTFSVTEELSFAKDTYYNGSSRSWFPRSFVFSGGYLYVAFDKVGGLCKVNMANPSDYQQLITDSDDANDVPNSYVLGENGALYYIANGALYVINLEPTQEEYTNAAAVNALIAALPETVTAGDNEQIQQAQAAYEALTVMERALITDAVRLEDAWISLLIARIDLLEQTLSAENMQLTETLKADYDKVSMKRRSEVTNYAVLAELNDIVVQSHYSVEGGTLYSKLSDAVAAAPEGGHIDLLHDWVETDVILDKDVTLDLNGYTLDVNAFAGEGALEAQGHIVDSSDGNEGLLQMEANAVFYSQNADLPVYDSAAGGYRFFDYDLTLRSTSESAGTGKQKFWFKFQFRANDTDTALDQDAYDLVAAGGTGLEISTKLTWKGNDLPTVTFGRSGVADVFSQEWATGATESRWLYLIVKGLGGLSLSGTLTVEPVITINGVTVSSGTITYEKTNDFEYGYVDRPQ